MGHIPAHKPAIGGRRREEADLPNGQPFPPPHVGGYGSGVQSANLGWGNSLPAGAESRVRKSRRLVLTYPWRLCPERPNARVFQLQPHSFPQELVAAPLTTQKVNKGTTTRALAEVKFSGCWRRYAPMPSSNDPAASGKHR